jgi:hypothetical protein
MNVYELLDIFDDSIQDWGYIQAEGSNEAQCEAENKYMDAKQKLIDKIAELEKLAVPSAWQGFPAKVIPPVSTIRRRKINWDKPE